MALHRSPRYPAVDLSTALTMIGKIFDAEGRAPIKEDIAMKRLGYNGLNGASLKVLSALRKYGLLEGGQGSVKVSQDAIVILANRHQADNADRLAAIQRAAFRVELFSDLFNEFGPEPSEQNLAAQLMVRGFSQEGSVKAARAYRATMALVKDARAPNDAAPERLNDASSEGIDSEISAPPSLFGMSTVAPPGSQTAIVYEGEREWLRGPLSRETSYRLIVSGDMGPRQIGKLIKLLQAQQAVLEDEDDDLTD